MTKESGRRHNGQDKFESTVVGTWIVRRCDVANGVNRYYTVQYVWCNALKCDCIGDWILLTPHKSTTRH